MSDSTFYLPDLGEGLIRARIIEWHVAVGDHVVKNQTLVEVETTKAAVEIPSGFSGQIKALRAKADEEIAVGAPLFDYVDDASANANPDGPRGIVGSLPQKSDRKRRVRLRPPRDE